MALRNRWLAAWLLPCLVLPSLLAAQDTPTLGKPLPRSDNGSGESSSKDTKISPSPAVEAPTPGTDTAAERPWDPHKAEKDIEVGDFYMHQKNYPAAISRYREALYWKQDDAMAQFRLGQALEGVGQYTEACKNYEKYVEILPQGKFAGDARKALQRLKGKPDSPKKAEGPIL